MIERLGDSLATTRTMLSDFLPAHEAEREARLILCHALGIGSAQLLARLEDPWPPGDAPRRFLEVFAARKKRQPLGQIIGEVEFYGRAFHVTPDVLTPRPDTESVIDICLTEPFSRVLDLGTGSGCILATLLSERPTASGLGTDLSQDALDVAARNIARHGLAARADLRRSDWFDAVDDSFDLIVSNPPYIAADDMRGLAPEVHDWEPALALTPGGDGLGAYRAICSDARRFLTRGGRLIVEIGHEQGGAVSAFFEAADLADVAVHPDINGRDRVVSGRCP